MFLNLLVTAVPLPGVTRSVGHEISRPLVLHSLREAQKNPDAIVCGVSAVSRAEEGKTLMRYCSTE